MKKLFLEIILLVFVINSIAFAKTYDLSQISQVKLVTEYSDDTTVNEMDTVIFGSYPQSDTSGATKEPIEWVVLDRQGNEALILSKCVLDCKCYNASGESVDWENCSLRNWLNNSFVNNAFSEEEKASIQYTKLINKGNTKYNTGDESSTNDYIFALSLDEIETYFYSESAGKYRKGLRTIPTLYAASCKNEIGRIHSVITRPGDIPTSMWWLRTKGRPRTVKGGFGATYVYDIYPIISFDLQYRDIPNHLDDLITHGIGVRPALWINLVRTDGSIQIGGTPKPDAKSIKSGIIDNGTIIGLPSRESEFRSDNHFYLDNSMQKSTWVYYKTYYYHVDGNGNIQKNQWIELRYVGADGRMYRGRQTPDGKWVGDDGLVVDVGSDLSKSLTIEAAEPDSWYKTQSGLWYYFENDRTTTKKGWFTDSRDNQTYYLDPQTGIMAVGWTTINGGQYYFNESHDNEPNWYEIGGGFYESYNKKVKAYGSMYKNETTPDGKKVDANGRLVN